jgi:hypothetical protein
VEGLQCAFQERAGYPFPAEIRSHSEVENFPLVVRHAARHQESNDAIPFHRDQEILPQVVCGVPTGRTRTGLLDGADGVQIFRAAAPDYCHIVIMHALLPLFFFLVQPFWETKPPETWTDAQIETVRTDSPWAQRTSEVPVAVVYLATAAPIEHAEAELRLRLKKNPHPLPEPDPDYVEYLSLHRAENFVLAVTYPTLAGLSEAGESKRMEEESVMLIGKKSYPIVGHFPPTPSDPVLRLIFPRAVKPSDKTVLFRIYLGGLKFPEREVEFRVKDLSYQGKLEM